MKPHELNYTIIPRSVASDYRSRKITRQERILYEWLRMIANPYGTAVVDMQGVGEDCLGNVSTSYVNKILLSLKSKRYIYYESRAGCRGSFEVKLGDVILPRKDTGDENHVTSIEKYFTQEQSVEPLSALAPIAGSEVRTELVIPSQRSVAQKKKADAAFSSVGELMKVRGYDTDTETHPDTESDDTLKKRTKYPQNEVTPLAFIPTSHVEEKAKSIASALGEKTMGTLLWAMREYGEPMVTVAWKNYEGSKGYQTAKNKGAYFMAVLKGNKRVMPHS
ncbi:hypothetical protein EXS57_03845 [Candidatus Kaiserbacteria bacterium]|nr:hypothetical protein [Candidatus Kaiserbacteria bacterium]